MFSLLNIKPASEQLIRSGVYIMLLNSVARPPHLSLIVQGKQFSLSVKGAAIGSDMSGLLRTVRSRKLPTLFIELQLPLVFTIEDIQNRVANIFSAHPSIEPGQTTCLTPIKEFCGHAYKADMETVALVFDLLPKLEQKHGIGEVYHLNMEALLEDNNTFTLPEYSMYQVNESIYASRETLVR